MKSQAQDNNNHPEPSLPHNITTDRLAWDQNSGRGCLPNQDSLSVEPRRSARNFMCKRWMLYKKLWIAETWSFLEMARSQATCSLHLQSESMNEHSSRFVYCNILENKGRICSSSLPEDDKSFLDLHSAPFSFPSCETAHSPVWLKGLPFFGLAWPVSCLLAGHSSIYVSSMFWTKT